MKIIDLLNKIANGEEVPEKIKCRNFEYIYSKEICWYRRIDDIGSYVEWFISADRLNETIKIIEEQEEIDIQGIEKIRDYRTSDDDLYNDNFGDFRSTINELVQAVKQLDKKNDN